MTLIAVLGCASLSAPAVPVSLMAAFADAAHHDPTYQIEQADYQATRMQLPQTYSAMLPQLNIFADIDREWDHIDGTGSGSYTTHDYGLSVTQTIFDWNLLRRISRAAFTVRAAATQLAYDQQQLIIRTARAYYRVLEQQDILHYTKQQVHILTKQLEQTKQLYNHKEATITDIEQVKGAYYDRLNDLEEARLDLYKAQQDLFAITAVQYKRFAKLKQPFPLVRPTPIRLSTWEQSTSMNNLKLNAARLTVQAAKRAISAERGGYLPVIGAQGGYTLTKEPTSNTNGLTTQNARDANLGLNLVWHAFQGGLTIATVKQAQAQYQSAYAQMTADYLDTLAEARSAYQGIIYGSRGILHARAGIKWNMLALEHGDQSFKAGESTVTDLLGIQEKLFSAENKYARDTYSYLVDILLLKQAAGTLSVHDLAIQNSWLAYE